MESNKDSKQDRKGDRSNDADDSSRGEVDTPSLDPEIQANRTNMAICNFFCTVLKWSIGFFLFLASYTSPLPTAHSAIREPIDELRALVRMEAKSYQDCVQRSSSRMQSQLENVATQDLAILSEIHESNKIHILEAQEVTGLCFSSTQEARRSLIQWENDGMALPWREAGRAHSDNPGTGVCTPQKFNQTAHFLGQDFRHYENQASDAMEAYLDESQSSFGRMQSYAEARFDYDFQYFVVSRIQPAIDYLAQHTAELQAVAITFELDLSHLEARFRDSLVGLETVLEKAKHHIDILQEKLEQYAVSIGAFHTGYTNLYHRLELSVDYTIDLLPPGANLPDFLDLSELNVPEFYLPDTSLTWPEFGLDYQAIHDLLDQTAKECMMIMLEVLEHLQAQANQQLRGALQQLSNALLSTLELKDYNPPKFQGSRDNIGNFDQELDYQSDRQEETRAWMREALKNLRLQGLNVDVDAFSTPELPPANYSYVESTTNFEYLSMNMPRISIPEFLANLMAWLAVNTWAFEIAVQAYRLWRLESVYAKGAIPKVPEVNFGDGDGESENYKTKYYLLTMVVKLMWMPHLVAMVGFTIVVGIISARFWYPHVHQSCIETTNGTFLARNFLSPWYINQASVLGNAHYHSAEFSCQQSQHVWCTDIAAQAEARHQADWTTFQSLYAQHNNSLGDLGLLQDCLDVESLSKSMNEACCGLKGYGTTECLFPDDLTCPIDSTSTPPTAFLPLDTFLTSPSCQSDFEWHLSDAQYSCSRLVEVCQHQPCAGVDQELIKSRTIQTDCEVQLYVINICYFLVAFVLHAACINIVCTLLFQGTQRILWRELSPNGIKLKTQIKENGDLVKGGNIEERAEKTKKATQRYEFVGKVELVTAAILFFAYVIATSVFVYRKWP